MNCSEFFELLPINAAVPVPFFDSKDYKINPNLQYFHRREKKYQKKSKYFTFLLYPENVGHMHLLYNLVHVSADSVAFILHKPDDETRPEGAVYSEDDDHIVNDDNNRRQDKYKQHIHVLVKYSYSKMWCGPITELFRYGVFYCEPVTDPQSLLMYFLHRTLNARLKNKPVYEFDELYRNNEFVAMVKLLEYRANTYVSGSNCNAMSEIIYLIQLHAPNDYEGLVLDVFANEYLVDTWQRNQMTINNLCVRYGFELFDKIHSGRNNRK